VPLRGDMTTHVVSSAARLHGNPTRRHVGREAQHTAAADPLAQENSPVSTESNELAPGLAEVDTESRYLGCTMTAPSC
jgi:hypothetical protein